MTGLLIRLVLLVYCIYHDSYIDHIKYTDVDYHVFTNGSKAIAENRSPYEDTEYRYPPLVAFIFLPNVLINHHIGKLVLIFADLLCGKLVYLLSIHQGTHRAESKLTLAIWLFNPVTLAISTRGSFEPIQTLVVLSSVYLLTKNCHAISGALYGLSIHLKLYPIIYALLLYSYMMQRKPYLRNETKIYYWLRNFQPQNSHYRFFISAIVSFLSFCFLSYMRYGFEYIDQSFIYHFKRRDLQHNFSIYFYLFRLFPEHQELLSKTAFVFQLIGVLIISLIYLSVDTNPRVKLRKLNFGLFCTTFLFVSLNKVCTSQYFSWYLIYLPLIIDSLSLDLKQSVTLILVWILAQANWLMFAYLYEYQGYDTLDYVGNCSMLFLMSNLWTLVTLCQNFSRNRQRSAHQD